MYFNNKKEINVEKIFMVDLLYSQARFGCRTNLGYIFGVKTLFREFEFESINSKLGRDYYVIPNWFAFLGTSTFVFAYKNSSFYRPDGIALARLDFDTNNIEFLQQLAFEEKTLANSQSG